MLRNQQLRGVVAARFVSLTGTNMTAVALPWFVLATTGSTARMGVVVAAQFLPSIALGGLSGGVVASLGPRRALIACDLLRAPLLLSVPTLYWLGALSYPVLLALVVAVGVFQIPYAAAASSLLPEFVGEDEGKVSQANAALQVAIQATGVVGPILAGVLIPALGASSVLVLDGASYIVSGCIVSLAVRAGRPRAQELHARGALAGVRHLVKDNPLVAILVAALVAHFGLVALFTTLPAIAFERFHDARAGGVLFAADAVGSVLGGLAAMRLLRRVAPMRVGVLGFAAMAAPLWLLVASAPFGLMVVVMFLFGVGGPLGVAPIGGVLTTRSPAAIRPKVVAAFLAITAIGSPLGALAAGFGVERVGFSGTYACIAAAVTTATIVLGLASRQLGALAAPAPAPTPS